MKIIQRMRSALSVERMRALKTLVPFVKLVWAISPGLVTASVALRLFRAVVPIATLYVGKLIIDDVVALVQARAQPLTLADVLHSPVAVLIAAEFALAVSSDVLWRVTVLIDSLLSDRLSTTISVRLMEHAATLDLAQFEDAEFQDQLERARSQASGRMSILWQLLQQLQDIVTVVSFAAGLFLYAPWLIVLLCAALVPTVLGELHFNKLSHANEVKRTRERRELGYLRQTAASVETAKEVILFDLSGYLIDRYRRVSIALQTASRHLARRRALWGAIFTAIGTFAHYIAYSYIVWRTLNGSFSLGDLTFLSGSFRRLHTLLEGFLSTFSNIAGQALYLRDLFAFFEVTPRLISPELPRAFPPALSQGFVFEDVGFMYPGTERWAVRHLDFELRAGEVLALVGENGAGKSTIVKLLTRLYDPTEGRILVDGHDLRDYDLSSLRANIGVIFQDFVRYHVTASDNIAAGRIAARTDQGRIARAARRGLADSVIAKLPAGYDQVVGRMFKDGVELSGGEWQKIAIARAYMRDAAVLVLDEPTAALDARAEYEVFQRFRDLSEKKTVMLISHRFSSIRMADRILVLVDGKVEASGSHAELMREKGRYSELFELQADGYR